MTDASDPAHHIDQTTDIDQLRRIAKGWLETAAQHARNEEFYRGIAQQTGRILGRECYRQDDGNYVDEPLALRVPEVAAKLCAVRSLAAEVAKRYPGGRVGVGESIIDGDWCVYLNGSGIIFGHSQEDVAAALSDLGSDDEYPRQYARGALCATGVPNAS